MWVALRRRGSRPDDGRGRDESEDQRTGAEVERNGAAEVDARHIHDGPGLHSHAGAVRHQD